MNTQQIQKKFSKIYSFLNIIFYFYIALFFILIFSGIGLLIFIDIDFNLVYTDLTLFLMFLFAFILFSGYFIAVFVLLLELKKLVFDIKNGSIFTEKNKTRIKRLFMIFSILLSILFLVISGGIFILFVLFFLWVLYEIFFIGFDYKIENDNLKEENNLTI